MGIEFKKNIGELELGLQFLLNFSHEWELEWESPWFLDQLLISDEYIFFIKMYLTEIPPIHLRGLAGTLSQLTVVTGILLSNIFGLRQIFGKQQIICSEQNLLKA
jgi:hypothetical protein